METKWLEDFVSLAQTRSFSRSAQLRHVTQPAFSRRIQSLEAWAGTDLVDRSSYPTKLTPAGGLLYEQALAMLAELQATRASLRSHAKTAKGMLEFAVPHNLALSFFPHWMMQLRQHLPQLRSRLQAFNVHDAVLRLVEGACDLLLAYHHPSHPIALDPAHYDMLVLGHDRLGVYARPDVLQRGAGSWPPQRSHPMPWLAYAAGAYLGMVVESALKKQRLLEALDRVYETEMSEGLKAMALQGQGVAFLPASAVAHDVQGGRLARLEHAPQIELEVRIYRQHHNTQRAEGDPLERLWLHLQQQAASSATAVL